MAGTVSRPPFDPEIERALAEQGVVDPPLLSTLTIEMLPRARELASAKATSAFATAMESHGRDFRVDERQIPGPDGAPSVTLLILEPPGSADERPVIFWIHGGGMVRGDRRTGIGQPLTWAHEHGAVVISVEYRLAPENPHPAPVEDCYAGLCWIGENATELGVDPRRLLVAGSSAGAGLATAIALMSRDRGGPRVLGQLLIAPMLDDRECTPSSVMLDGEGVWDRTSNRTGWRALLGAAAGGSGVSSYAAPARADDLTGMPPTYLDTGSVDTFRDEVITYGSRLWEAGCPAELHVWSGACHGFNQLAPHAAVSIEAQTARANWIGRLLRADGHGGASPGGVGEGA